MFKIESQIIFGLINIVATILFLLAALFALKTIHTLLEWWKAEKSVLGFSLIPKLFNKSACSDLTLSMRSKLFRNMRYTLLFLAATTVIILLFSHGDWNKVP